MTGYKSRKKLEGTILSCCQNIWFCRNGHSYETALLLSVFLGMFGIDRFYLGYPAIGKCSLHPFKVQFLNRPFYSFLLSFLAFE